MEEKKIKFKNLQLSASVFVAGNKGKMPGVLFVHGWNSGQDRFFSLAQDLAQRGYCCLTFDLPGHGRSGGDVNNLSIENYLEGCVTAYDFLVQIPSVDPNDITVIGSSFGSYLGAILTSRRSVKNLILRAPSNYPDNEFQEIKAIRGSDQPGVLEWRSEKLGYSETQSLRSIHEFHGRLLVVESEKDEMVPRQTIQNYIDATRDKGKFTYYLMKDAPHSLAGHQDLIKEFNGLVVDWLGL